MSTAVARTREELVELATAAASQTLEGKPAEEIVAWAVEDVRRAVLCDQFVRRRRAGPRRVPGRAGRRRGVPRHRPALRRDAAGTRHRAAHAAGHRALDPAPADRRRAGRASTAPSSTRGTPTSAATCARSSRWSGRSSSTTPGRPGCAATSRRPGRTRRSSGSTISRQKVKVSPLAALDAVRRGRVHLAVQRAGQHAAPPGVRVGGLLAVHPPYARRARTRARAGGRCSTRPSAVCTCDSGTARRARIGRSAGRGGDPGTRPGRSPAPARPARASTRTSTMPGRGRPKPCGGCGRPGRPR